MQTINEIQDEIERLQKELEQRTQVWYMLDYTATDEKEWFTTKAKMHDVAVKYVENLYGKGNVEWNSYQYMRRNMGSGRVDIVYWEIKFYDGKTPYDN